MSDGVANLGHSRASFVRFKVGEDTDTRCACLRDALFFRGVPARVLLDFVTGNKSKFPCPVALTARERIDNSCSNASSDENVASNYIQTK